MSSGSKSTCAKKVLGNPQLICQFCRVELGLNLNSKMISESILVIIVRPIVSLTIWLQSNYVHMSRPSIDVQSRKFQALNV